MSISIFKSGEKSSFAEKSRSMAKVLALGAGSLAIVFAFFIFFYFPSENTSRIIAIILPFTYLGVYLISLNNISNKYLYRIVFYVFIFTSYCLLYIAYLFSFSSDYIIIMLVIYNIILFTLPKPQHVLSYFGIVFIPLEILLFQSPISLGFTLLISVSFAYVFILSYVIAKQKKGLNKQHHQNAEILKTLVNSSNDAILLVDHFSKKIWDANEKTKEVFGFENIDEIINQKYYQLFADEEFIPKNRNEITQLLTKNGYYQEDVLFKRKDGVEFWGHLLISPFKAFNNNFYLIQIKNVDTKKKNDDKLIANNEQFNFILSNVEELIYLISYDDNNKETFEYISPYIEHLFGLTQDEYLSDEIRNKLNKIYHPEDLPLLKKLKKELTDTKKSVETNYRIKPIGKTAYITLHEKVIPYVNEQGEIKQLLGIIREEKSKH